MRTRSPIALLIAATTVLVPLLLALHPAQSVAAAARTHRPSRAKSAEANKKTTVKSRELVQQKAATPARTKARKLTKTHSRAQSRAQLRAESRREALSRRSPRVEPAVMRRERGHRSSDVEDGNPRLASVPSVIAPRLQPSSFFIMPPPLRGTHESLVHQNIMAEQDGLERILDDDDLADRISHGSLVPVPTSSGLSVNTDLPENRRYCRPWTARFLKDLAAAHAARFPSSPIEVTSAVRTVEFQRQLRTYNGNAAAAEGDIASPHLTGGTIDLAKQGMTRAEVGWLRAWLIPLEQAGKIDVAEEFRQACFHISVYKSYTESKPDDTTTAAKPAAKSTGKPSVVASPSLLATHGR